MSITQFAMVEELAFLVKDNLPCKHLLLSLEESWVNFLENDSSAGVLKLEPMNPYHRLLAHRLAEIFGFYHESVGEGEDRHLILERCEETLVPSILVSDLLWQFDTVQSPISYDVLRRNDHDSMQGQRVNVSSGGTSVEDREAAYIAARERIFAGDACEDKLVKERPRHNPVVARRMITHALGQSNQDSLSETKARAQTKHETTSLGAGPISSRGALGKTLSSAKVDEVHGSKAPDSKLSRERNKSSKLLSKGDSGTKDSKEKENYLRNEHLGAAKRLFANALGVQRRDVSASKCDERKKSIV